VELVSPAYFNIVATIAMIGGLALAVWWILAMYSMRTREEEDVAERTDLPDGLAESSARVPPALKLFFLMVAVTMIAYVVYDWLGGVSY
jgi:hypothetical protein